MLQWEHSAILLTFIKLPFVIKNFVLSFFEWPLKTGFTVQSNLINSKSWELDISFGSVESSNNREVDIVYNLQK